MKFYEVQQKNGHNWTTLAFFREKKDAEKHMTLYNTKVMISAIKVIEREFSKGA